MEHTDTISLKELCRHFTALIRLTELDRKQAACGP